MKCPMCGNGMNTVCGECGYRTDRPKGPPDRPYDPREHDDDD